MRPIARPIARLAALLLVLVAAPAFAEPVKAGHVTVELVAQGQATPGGTVYVALRQKLDRGWHTYWRNSGDAGGPTKIDWTLPAGWKAGDIVWPTPEKLRTGPLMNFVFSDEVVLPVPIEVPASAQPGQAATLKAQVGMLVCSDVCIPEEASLTLSLPVAASPAQDAVWGPKIAAVLAAAPKPEGLDATFAVEGGKIRLSVAGAPLKGKAFSGAYFFPFDPAVVDHASDQAIERGPDGATLTLVAGYEPTHGKVPATLSGVLDTGDGAYQVDARPGPSPAGTSGLGAPAAKAQGGGSGGLGLPLAGLYALLGGLILNLMPCVFPVLSMKAASLAQHGHDAKAARSQGIAFLVGSMLTFLALAALLIGAKAAGQQVGWGFQLQSPAVVGALAVLMLLVGLDLAGVFEVGASLQGAGQGLASRGGLAGAFFTGVLAVVVAAPCTAPFMGPAIGLALTASPAAALVIFAALGLGFSLPFTVVAFVPALLRRLPRPGAWMDALKTVLAFPMFGAAAWLTWVLSNQAGSTGLARLLVALIAAAFGAWLFGAGQRARMFARPGGLLQAGGGAVMLAAFAAAAWPSGAAPAGPTAAPADNNATLASEPWSPARVAALQADKRPVLVDFTAGWCVTCQVNEKVALSSAKVADAFKRTNAVYLKGDWTNRDAAIAEELAKHGRAGVPLYLVYPAAGGEPKVLPQLLTEGMVIAALDEAAK